MAIFKVFKHDSEQFTLETNPTRTFSSSSAGATGSVYVFPRRSPAERETSRLSPFNANDFEENSLDAMLQNAVSGARAGTDISAQMSQYLDTAGSQSLSSRKYKTQTIYRFEPSFTFTADTLRKNVTRQILFPFYRAQYDDLQYAYTNYHCLNFFTASTVPSDSALLYPNTASYSSEATYASGNYSLTGAFTFDFYINPKYTCDKNETEFKAGTIFHLSSTYAVSLVTGSMKHPDGRPSSFRIMLQLSHSADQPPSTVDTSVLNNDRTYPDDLIFLSDNNTLLQNNWHHIGIRWGTNSISEGSGSFFIDGVRRGKFNVPSASIAPASFGGIQGDPDALIVGNYYNSPNVVGKLQAGYFAYLNTSAGFPDQGPSFRDGVSTLFTEAAAGSAYQYGPSASLDHPLNAELHELKIYNTFRSVAQIKASMTAGPTNLRDLVFYAPPFFTRESPTRSVQAGFTGNEGGVPQTPFFGIDSSTDDPFNVALSFGVGGHDINVENFGRDFANNVYPRWLGLTGSTITTTSELLTCNQFLFATGTVRKRNLTVLPCDNGLFKPNFGLLLTGAYTLHPKPGHVMDKYVNDLGVLDLSLITLTELIPTSTLRPGLIPESGSIFDSIVGAAPDNLGVDPGEVLTIFQRTRDNSSNEVAFFDISNLYYGNAIKSGTFSITDSSMTGSGGKISMRLRDNGRGGLYRADSLTPHAQWNNVGSLLYDEGLAVIKSPNIPFFGRDQFSITLRGTENIHTLKFSVLAPQGQLNSSSNPQYTPLSASLNANDANSEFVYIDGINFHDENLNVIMKTKFAQPILKRFGDKILFKSKLDF